LARRGITLTEVLIAILVLGVGMVSLAALFPIGLTRLRDAARYSRSAYLTQSGASDATARGLLNKQAFFFADMLNTPNFPATPYWYATPVGGAVPNAYDPFTQDTPFYGGNTVDPNTGQQLGVNTNYTFLDANGNPFPVPTGLGLPIAYDPLWRFQTGIYLDPLGQSMPEARFGAATLDPNNPAANFIRPDPDGGPASAWGLQRLTNFNRPAVINALGATVPLMPSALMLPSIFVSPEDTVWQDPNATTSTVDGLVLGPPPAVGNVPGAPVARPSPVVPDLNVASSLGSPTNDWRYSWMLTVQQTSVPIAGENTSLGATFDGNVVIFENRPFAITQINGPFGNPTFQVAGETVVEAVFGAGSAVVPQGGPGYASGSDRSVILRWPDNTPDPVVKAGDFIADVTYERNNLFVTSRFGSWPQVNGGTGGLANPADNLEWDNLPAQRCYWYRVQRVTPPINDPNVQNHRSMTVYVDASLQSRTVLNANGQPVHLNAALISPYVVNVIPQTFFVR
jgi:hypothetical protein